MVAANRPRRRNHPLPDRPARLDSRPRNQHPGRPGGSRVRAQDDYRLCLQQIQGAPLGRGTISHPSRRSRLSDRGRNVEGRSDGGSRTTTAARGSRRDVTRTFRHLSPIRVKRVQTVALIRVQRLTGRRPMDSDRTERSGCTSCLGTSTRMNTGTTRSRTTWDRRRGRRLLRTSTARPINPIFGITASRYYTIVVCARKLAGIIPHWRIAGTV